MELRPWIALPIALLAIVGQAQALLLTVQNTECVWEDVEYDGDVVSGNFVVLDHEVFWGSDHPGIELIVTGPDGRNVHNTNTIDGEQFEFIAHHKGRYKFCFHNPLSAPEQVTFYIHVGHVPGVEDLAKDEHLKPVDVKIAQLGELLEAVSAEIRYLQTRDLRHRRKPTYSCDYSNCLLTSLPHFFDHNPQADLLILLGVVVAKPDEPPLLDQVSAAGGFGVSNRREPRCRKAVRDLTGPISGTQITMMRRPPAILRKQAPRPPTRRRWPRRRQLQALACRRPRFMQPLECRRRK